MKMPIRLAALAAAGLVAVGLTACTLFESEEPEAEDSAASEVESTENTDAEEQEGDGLEALVGEWSENVDMLGGTLTIDADGYLFVQAEGGPVEGYLLAGDGGSFNVEIVPAEGNSARGADEEPRQDWVLTYDAETDTIQASETWSDGEVHETSYSRA